MRLCGGRRVLVGNVSRRRHVRTGQADPVVLGFAQLRHAIDWLVAAVALVMVLGWQVRRCRDRLAVAPVAALGAATPPATTATAPAAFFVLLGLPLGLFVGLEERLPVGDRDLVVVGVDLAEREKPVPVAAILDERGLQGRFDARDLGEIDVAAELAAARRFEIEFLDLVSARYDNAGLLLMGGVDEHLVGHIELSKKGSPVVPGRAHRRDRSGWAGTAVAARWRGGRGRIMDGRRTRARSALMSSAAGPPSTRVGSEEYRRWAFGVGACARARQDSGADPVLARMAGPFEGRRKRMPAGRRHGRRDVTSPRFGAGKRTGADPLWAGAPLDTSLEAGRGQFHYRDKTPFDKMPRAPGIAEFGCQM